MNRSRSVHRLVAVITLAGMASVGVTIAATRTEGVGDLRLLVISLLALGVMNAVPIAFQWKGESEHVSIEEAFYCVLVMTSPPAAAVIGMLFGTLVGSVYHRRPLIKLAFNVGTFALSVSAALAVTRLVAGDIPVGSDWRGVGGAAAGAVTFYVATTLAVRAIVAIVDRLQFTRLFEPMTALEIVILSSGVSFGLLAGLASHALTLGPLLAFPPLAVVGFVLHHYGQAVQDRHQLHLLLDTAVTTNEAIGVQGVQGVVVDAACQLLHTTDARIQLDPPSSTELGSRIETESSHLWLVARPSDAHRSFTPEEQSLLDGLAALASASLSSAELLDRVRHQAFHDSLTGLANRFLLEDRVKQALLGRGNQAVGVLFMDLDRFKRVNDSLGHHAGDHLLQQFAERLSGALRVGDSAARLGGDEFAVLLPGLESEETALEVAQRISAAIREPFPIEGREVFVTVSIGVAVSPGDGTDFATLLRSADVAMYDAKDAGRDLTRRRSTSPRGGALLALETELRHAIEHDELCVAYQPQLDLMTMKIVGAEALVRWLHPTRGPMQPGAFLPLAEACGILGAIDEWVLVSACQEAAAWKAAGATDLRVAVNFSDRHLRAGAVDLVQATLERVGLPASWLEIEVTEQVVATEGAVSAALADLQRLGVRVSLDDFGTGYSSLSRLRTMPVDVLKIDQSFVREIVDSNAAVPLVSSAIAMAHGLELIVVAEGVETPEQVEFLTTHGCDRAQGYLLGRPMPAEELYSRLLRELPSLHPRG